MPLELEVAGSSWPILSAALLLAKLPIGGAPLNPRSYRLGAARTSTLLFRATLVDPFGPLFRCI